MLCRCGQKVLSARPACAMDIALSTVAYFTCSVIESGVATESLGG